MIIYKIIDELPNKEEFKDRMTNLMIDLQPMLSKIRSAQKQIRAVELQVLGPSPEQMRKHIRQERDYYFTKGLLAS